MYFSFESAAGSLFGNSNYGSTNIDPTLFRGEHARILNARGVSSESCTAAAVASIGEANSMLVATEAMNDLVWSVEAKKDVKPFGEKVTEGLKKFWDWIIAGLKKLWEGLVNFVKSIMIKIKGSGKKYSEFYTYTWAKFAKPNLKAKVRLTLPKETFETSLKATAAIETTLKALAVGAAAMSGNIKDADVEKFVGMRKASDENLSRKKLHETAFGEEATPKTVTVEEAFKACGGIEILKDAGKVQSTLRTAQEAIRVCKVGVGNAKKQLNKAKSGGDDKMEMRRKVATALQGTLSTLSASTITLAGIQFRILDIVYTAAKVAVKGKKATDDLKSLKKQAKEDGTTLPDDTADYAIDPDTDDLADAEVEGEESPADDAQIVPVANEDGDTVPDEITEDDCDGDETTEYSEEIETAAESLRAIWA